ncbi:MAG: tetratricopeptide repeat protein [Symploca sp. SIO2D2]|nr:tetratricopeptide repeat protein [Symploca sp. SIO2D2]
MDNLEKIKAILDRMAEGQHSDTDVENLGQLLNTSSSEGSIQLGKNIVGKIDGQEIQIGDRIYQGVDAEAIKEILQGILQASQLDLQLTGIPDNLPRSGVVEFIGREQELATLHQQLQENEQVAVSALTGMGGVGKTELALQYALKYKQTYPGGICWLQARSVDIGTQIVQFARSRLQLNPSEELDVSAQVGFCWSHWRLGKVLVVIDDVLDYKLIRAYLPPSDSRFKVLITSRLRLGASIKQLEIDVLEESSAIALLVSLAGSARIEQEFEQAKQLCKWLGYLPLAMELVGRYLNRSPHLSIAQMQQRLEKKRLEERSLRKPDDDMTLSLGVAAAFELSWETLDEDAKELSYLLSLFALAPIPWTLVEQVATDYDPDDLEEIRDDNLLNLHLLQRKGKDIYQLHQLIREFMQGKYTALVQSEDLKQIFCRGIMVIAQQVPESPTRELLLELELAMPHIAEIATSLCNYLNDEELLDPFRGLSRFYEGQGFYVQQEIWCHRCLEATEKRFGNEHPSVATSLNGLASAYRIQGKYLKAKPLYEKALAMRYKFLAEEHPDIADSFNSLGLLLKAQGKYAKAEPMYLQALAMRRKLFGEEHPEIAESLNNLALLYRDQGRYQEAELLFLQALEMRQKLLGETHPRVASSFNSLASCYDAQKRYEESEPLYFKALQLRKQLQGEEHPNLATVLNNIGQNYAYQRRYEEAEPMFLEALEIQKRVFGEEHPDIAFVLNNLASVYSDDGKLADAEPLYKAALDMRKRLLGANHPNVAISMNNLARLYRDQKRYTEAELLYINAIEVLNSQLNSDHPTLIRVKSNLEEIRIEMNAN